MPKKNHYKRNAHLRLHARRRAGERYGINLTKDKQAKLVKLIQNPDCRHKEGRVVIVEKQSHTRIICFVWLEDDQRWLLVAYDRKRRGIATVLPPEGDGLLHPSRQIPAHRPT